MFLRIMMDIKNHSCKIFFRVYFFSLKRGFYQTARTFVHFIETLSITAEKSCKLLTYYVIDRM